MDKMAGSQSILEWIIAWNDYPSEGDSKLSALRPQGCRTASGVDGGTAPWSPAAHQILHPLPRVIGHVVRQFRSGRRADNISQPRNLLRQIIVQTEVLHF